MNDLLVMQNVTQVAITAKPVGKLLPSCLPVRIYPAVAFILEVVGKYRHLAHQSACIQLQLLSQPSARQNAARRELLEHDRLQRRPIGIIEPPFCLRHGLINNRDGHFLSAGGLYSTKQEDQRYGAAEFHVRSFSRNWGMVSGQ